MLSTILSLVIAPSILIQGGTILDGSGHKSFVGDLRITGDRITAIGKLSPLPNETIISAKGLAVAPGFIDAHSHAAGGIDDDPLAVSQLTQGITTAVVGQDGGWSQPLTAELNELAGHRPAINFASFSGHGGIRRKIMGDDYKRPATAAEIAKMRDLLRQDMKDGALGLSSGLEYDPGYYSTTEELIAMAKVAAKYKGMYISHIRDEADKSFEAFEELCRISREAKLHAQISHIKLGTLAVWNKAALTDKIGVKEKITADVYPYLYWHSTIAALSPSRDWEDRKIWERGLADVGGPQNVLLVGYTHEPTWVGKTLAEIATMTGKDAIAIIQEILRKTEGPGSSGSQHVVVTAMTENDLEHFIKSPRTMFCSDGAIGGSHPRGAGSFPRILGRYVREKKLISLPEAIRKMTSLTAKTFQLKDRGMLKQGFIADVVIFDPKTIHDNATPAHPTLLSEGIRDVYVSGVQTLSLGKTTGRRNGKMIFRNR